MKNRIALTSALAALLALTASGQDNPPTPSTPASPAIAPAPATPATPATLPIPAVPPVPPAPPSHRMRGDDRARGPYTFLGVETSRVSRVVSEQLGLPRGFGVVVDYVVPESAAAKAGLEQNDIIRMLNDQILVDSDQLGTLVRSYPDGTNVELTVLRKGKEMKLPVRLQQKQDKSDKNEFGYEWNFDGMEDRMAALKNMHIPDMSAVREVVKRAREDAARGRDDAARGREDAARAREQAREAARNLRVITTDDGTVKATHVDIGKAQIVYSDDKGELRLETVAGKRVLTAKDAAGKQIFQGPIDTDAERAAVPEEVRKRYENLEHQDLPAIPPNEDLAPRGPGTDESAHLRNPGMERAMLQCTPRTGWTRNTIML